MWHRRVLGEDLMDVRLAVAHYHQHRLAGAVPHLRNSAVALNPFETLFLFDGFAVAFFAAADPRSRPALQIQQSQRYAFGGKRHRIVHDQAEHMLVVTDRPKAFGMRMRAVIQCRRVLCRQHHILLAYSSFGRRVMRR